jgi:DNA-directed RNA polymerase subunit alpha
LKLSGIYTIGQLVRKTEDDLLVIRNFGVICLEEVKDILREYELNLVPSSDG